ncbi:putative MFS monocarboxylate transporter [Auriscalpium vulgare]|uniref:MFS monocarboxylate transporter n=1 Tax=Auriscalpium vulgare TaxID=40419 RepID=A0ACB8RYG8_9AGAM|nr:putative MFS monocarboxylate transporter [Auriscalpium vulgare]
MSMDSSTDPEKALRAKSFTEDPPTVTTPPPSLQPALPPAPDGGLLAWLQILSSFLIMFNTWGIINTFGSYQAFYETELLSSKSPSAIAWIGSMQGFLLLLVGSLTGPIFDAGYLRSLVAVGSFLIVFGMMMTSLSTEYYQVFLAQGVTVGLGAGCLFVPSFAVLASYFSKRRATALGIAASGSSLGGVVYPIVFHYLQPQVGFGWATRVIGFIALATLFVSFVTIRRRVPIGAKRKLFDLTALKEAPYVLFSMSTFFGFMGIYIPFYYIGAYALDKAGSSETLAFYFVPILNAASILGRILPNIFADRVGSMNTLIPCALICSILAYAWIGIDSTGGLLAFAILYGFFSGSFVSLPPSVIANLSPDLKVMGSRMGMSFCMNGLGILIGNPVAGAILNIQKGRFVHAQIFCATVAMAGAAFMVAARTAKVGLSLAKKV